MEAEAASQAKQAAELEALNNEAKSLKKNETELIKVTPLPSIQVPQARTSISTFPKARAGLSKSTRQNRLVQRLEPFKSKEEEAVNRVCVSVPPLSVLSPRTGPRVFGVGPGGRP